MCGESLGYVRSGSAFALVQSNLVLVQMKDLSAPPLPQPTVMRGDYNRAGVTGDIGLQRCCQREGEVVGWLVEKQERRRVCQQSGQLDAPLLADAQGGQGATEIAGL